MWLTCPINPYLVAQVVAFLWALRLEFISTFVLARQGARETAGGWGETATGLELVYADTVNCKGQCSKDEQAPVW